MLFLENMNKNEIYLNKILEMIKMNILIICICLNIKKNEVLKIFNLCNKCIIKI